MVKESKFEAAFLRAYADLVAKPLNVSTPLQESEHLSWLKPYDGLSQVGFELGRVPLWKNDGTATLPVLAYSELTEKHEQMVRTLLEKEGFVIIDGLPDDAVCDGSVIERFGWEFLGGLQKHPLRDTAYYSISTNDELVLTQKLKDKQTRSQTNSYNTDGGMVTHTDQALYATPGLVGAIHCARGDWKARITDGFAVAQKLRDEYPTYFAALSRHSMNMGRRVKYYDTGDLTYTNATQIIQTDKDGNVTRVQYHESYRAPSTLAYDDYCEWYEAYAKFYELVHSPEFMREVSLEKGQMLLTNNWRVMNGRGRVEGQDRVILGGTATRDSFYSTARRLVRESYNVPVTHCGAPLSIIPRLAERSDNGIGRGAGAFGEARPKVCKANISDRVNKLTMDLIRKRVDEFRRVDKGDEPPFRVLELGLPGEACPVPESGKPPYPYMIKRDKKFFLGYRFDQDVCDKTVRSSESLRSVFGEADKEADAFFRLGIGYAAATGEFNADKELVAALKEALLPAALRVYGEEGNEEAARASRVYSMYCNALLPGHVINMHLDVPEFLGVDRSQCPNWLLVAAHCSGLFGTERVRNATTVFYPREANGSDLAVYAKTDEVVRSAPGTAVVLDTDSCFHHSAPVLNAGSDVPPPAPHLPDESFLRLDGEEWVVVDKGGRELARHAEGDIRFSISCKIHVFRDEAEAAEYAKGGATLTVQDIIDRLTQDLVQRGKLSPSANLPLYEIGPLMVEEYIAPLAPTRQAIEDLWVNSA
jgi:hypothetical protein